MSDITLSFCITTRDRAAFIGVTLENLISQATGEVEIVVLDAASTDGTGEVVDGFARRFPRLRYFRQDDNRGVDRDYDRTVELARGEYCWMMSDDDILSPGAVAEVLGYCRKGYDLIVANAEDRDSDLRKVLGERRLPFRENRVYRPSEANRFFTDAANHLSFIPSVVIRRDLWLSRDRSSYYGSLFIHVGVIFQERIPGDVLVVSRPLVSVRNANVSWAARSFEIWMFKWPGLIWSLPDFSDEAKEKVSAREPWKKLKALLTHRAMGSYSMEEYRRWIAPRTASVGVKTFAWLVAAAPGHLVNALALLYCVFLYGNSRIPRFNLSNSRFSLIGPRKRNAG
ncbi:MAG: glycosyltransferase family 2 protein [Deltaproteobacteria bacterium]|nr:MAG: glycosyltransferase family 2 protein [Deltaproteobacteria bacterium]